MGEPRSAVMSLHGDVLGGSGGGVAFFRGETFFAIDLIGEESVFRRDFFLGFLGVVDLVIVCGVSTGGPGRGVIGAPGGVIDVTTAAVDDSEPSALARSPPRFFFATGVGVASGDGGAPTK